MTEIMAKLQYPKKVAKISRGNGSACADECTSDSSCPGDQKCCSDECGLKCMDPEDG
jgi:hypothetical protein